MNTSEIRRRFIEYFQHLGHEHVDSSPVVIPEDPTLLFANAGMNQFKDVFLGNGERSYSRAVSHQKCIRVSGKHNDLEEVGEDTYHHTFFEMLGNWSFGDYYKPEAIRWAWQLLTEVWGLDKSRLYVTIYEGDGTVPRDDEAEQAWREQTDVDPAHILAFGKDNFWEMGDVGPCGPCTEIHYDLGEDHPDSAEPDCFVNSSCGRFVEIWNLVFIQYDRDETGKLTLLPRQHVDTGMGLERIAAILQGVSSNYDIDIFQGIISAVSRLSGVEYQESTGKPHRVIADHIRTLTFAIADGVLPSNDGRGYVLRRLLRRAARYGRDLGFNEPFMYQLVQPVIEQMGDAYPEINSTRDRVESVVRREEELFESTLDKGLQHFNKVRQKTEERGVSLISGPDTFRLYDTFGFPFDLTRVLAREAGLDVDEAGYLQELEHQKDASRNARGEQPEQLIPGEWHRISDEPGSRFLGYDATLNETRILRYARNDEGAVALVLHETVFYAESGGQVGDRGTIFGPGWKALIHDTRRVGDDIVHLGNLEGDFSYSSPVTARVNSEFRQAVAANHTATHLLHAALRLVLGPHVQQEGSLVEPGHLRFDFSHDQKMTPDQLERVERIVNEQVRQDTQVSCKLMAYSEAVEAGAMALFGEKYSDSVRVISVDDFSRELCGGTHLERTGEIGYFAIQSETSAAQGVRRIEALTGAAAQEYIMETRAALHAIRDLLGSHGSDELEKLRKTLEEKKALEKEIERLRLMQSADRASELEAGAVMHKNSRLVVLVDRAMDRDALLKLADELRAKMSDGVFVLAGLQKNKPVLILALGDQLISNGMKAGQLINDLAVLIDGKGGGRPHLAQAGGQSLEGLAELERQAVAILQNRI